MRYLRMLSNSVAAASLATAYILGLVLLLNPGLSRHADQVVPLASTVGVYYVIHLTVMFYVLLVVRQILAREVFSPAWVSVDVLGWLCAAGSGAGAALMWRNLATFGRVLDAATVTALQGSAVVLTAACVLFIGVAWLRKSAPAGRYAWAFLLVVIGGASVLAPLELRGEGTRPVLQARTIDVPVDVALSDGNAHVTVIAIDGGSLDFITRATAEGRLPNFGRILDAGAVRHLATLHPTSAEAVWAAVATGKLPQKNGVRSAGMYQLSGGGATLQLLPDYCFAQGMMRFGFLVEQPHSSATFRTRTLWSILSTEGFSVGVVGWPLTQPAPVVRGYLVSDTFQSVAMTASGIENASTIYPPELQVAAVAAMETAGADPPPIVPASLGGGSAADSHQDGQARTDRIYDRIARTMAAARPTQVTLTRYQSLDAAGHYFLRYAVPSEFGDVSDDERRRFGSVLEQQYTVVDEAVGRAMGSLGPDDVLLVVSGYGMQPLSLGKRLVERVIGDPEISGTHEAAPDGFLLAYGATVARGRQLQRASVVDIVPTILYYLGLPIGRDMDGYARTDLFQVSFTQDRPIAFIPTYER
jgi:predicted AlkP superfamily phosphohydrolase/phosphomutase